MKSACCSVLATSDTLLRRAPIICAIASWVSARVQQAPRQPGLHRVRGVAAGGLLDLGVDRQAMTDQRGAQRRALIGGESELVDIDRRGRAWHQHYGAVQRDGVAKRRERAEDAIAADHRNLHMFAARKLDDERNHAPVREVGALERFVDFDQHHVLA